MRITRTVWGGAFCTKITLALRSYAYELSYQEPHAIAPACTPLAGKDIPGGNDIGPVIHDEELFATVGSLVVDFCEKQVHLAHYNWSRWPHERDELKFAPHVSLTHLHLPPPTLCPPAERGHVCGPAPRHSGSRNGGAGAGGSSGSGGRIRRPARDSGH